MELALKDKVILVTGGASGIGQEIVKKLQALEAIPIVIDRVKKVEAKWGQDSIIIPEPPMDHSGLGGRGSLPQSSTSNN